MTAKQELMRARIYAATLLYAAIFAIDRFVLPASVPAAARLAFYVIP